MAKNWWKILSVMLLLYVIIGGFMVPVPVIGNNQQAARSIFFHLPMWMAMYTLLTISVVNSIWYLATNDLKKDVRASSAGSVGVLFGVMGFLTGMLWATYTWGGTIVNDPKQMTTAIALAIYMAYLVLRMSFTDIDKRARVSAIYNVFAFALLIPLTYIIPRTVDSLHPGSASSPGFSDKDTAGTIKMVLWPAFIGFTLLGIWIYTLRNRYKRLALKNILHG
ncbi:cytochrome c biogenesis protein CcsA [Chitinophaga rhizosphaerae]|uniref:cytochrome c biogenesis protein CcsA n=1 Tax=Chitinophaga rhizosphaerae TaxID=1864947 RepID=UPI000F7FBEEC|nr:cytochrome c biogenesis protein CcsA [Chitinophaga rhizosphaerae]